MIGIIGAMSVEVEGLKAKQNEVTKKIPAMKKAGENTDAIFAEMKKDISELKKYFEENVQYSNFT